MVSAQPRRRQVVYARQRGVSSRRACTLRSVVRSTLGYESRLVAKDAPVVAAMRELPAQYVRFGYRRIHVFLDRQGHAMSPDRALRLWRQTGLQVPRRRHRRRISTGRPRLLPRTGIGHVWTYDIVFDRCANGQQIKCLTVLDEFSRKCLAIDVAGGIRSGRVIEVLTQLTSVHGASQHIRSDNGPEFVARAILHWLGQINIETADIDPGKLWQNVAGESSNGKCRDECLSLEWFKNRIDAKIVIENCRRHYYETRPHSSLGYRTPAKSKLLS